MVRLKELLGKEQFNNTQSLEFGISQIPARAAARLHNATTPTVDDPSEYMVQLDVFHQLHCLNSLRKAMYPDVFNVDFTSGTEKANAHLEHLEHCYDQLRQSLMCHADIATIYFEWIPEKEAITGNPATTHTCKNYDKVIEWARAHTLKGSMDTSIHVEGAPVRSVPGASKQDHTRPDHDGH